MQLPLYQLAHAVLYASVSPFSLFAETCSSFQWHVLYVALLSKLERGQQNPFPCTCRSLEPSDLGFCCSFLPTAKDVQKIQSRYGRRKSIQTAWCSVHTSDWYYFPSELVSLRTQERRCNICTVSVFLWLIFLSSLHRESTHWVLFSERPPI